jgi:hypothetical protein
MSTRFVLEQDTVQDPLIRYADEGEWTYIPTSKALSLRKDKGNT